MDKKRQTLSQSRSHLVGQSAGNNHDVALTGRRSEHDTKPILVVPRSSHVPIFGQHCAIESSVDPHHLDGTARQTKGHWPHRSLHRPIGDLVEGRQHILCPAVSLTQQHASLSAHQLRSWASPSSAGCCPSAPRMPRGWCRTASHRTGGSERMGSEQELKTWRRFVELCRLSAQPATP